MRLGGKPLASTGQCGAASGAKPARNAGRRTEFRDRAFRDSNSAIVERHEDV